MNIAEKYEGKTIRELSGLFFEIGNANLVPELSKHIVIGVKKFRELQEDNDELNEMIIVADTDNKIFVFATGDGSELESKDDDCVFYIAESEKFHECMELIKYISFGNHPEGYLSLDSEAYHWIGDAMPDMEDEENLTIYGGYYYGETEVDPFFEA